MRAIEWIARDGDDNAESTAVQAAVTGKRHLITVIMAGYATTPATPKLLTVKKGTTVLFETYITTPAWLFFGKSPLQGDVDGAVSAVLAASGTGGVVSKVELMGYSEG